MPDIQPEIDALWDWGNPAERERRFRAAAAEAATNGQESRELQLLTQVIRALVLQRRFKDAGPVNCALELRRREVRDNAFEARFWLENGRWDNDLEYPDRGKRYFNMAEMYAKKEKLDCLQVDALHMLALVSGPVSAMEYHHQSIAVASASEDPRARRWLPTLYNNLGWNHFEFAEYDESLAALEEALRLRIAQGKPGPIHTARFCVAKVKRVLGHVHEALDELRRLIVTPPAGVPVWVKADGYGNEELGECLLALGNDVAARRHFTIAFDVLSKDPWLSQREPARIERLRELAGGAA